jgi:hypothetical protein
MEKGTKVYQAYASGWDDRWTAFVQEGVVTDIVRDGVPLVSVGNSFTNLDDSWHQRRHDAQRDIHRAMLRFIGAMQAKADTLAEEILQADLMTEEAAA